MEISLAFTCKIATSLYLSPPTKVAFKIGKDRTITVSLSNSMLSNDTVAMNVLQTDVAINSGNSGGPLCSKN